MARRETWRDLAEKHIAELDADLASDATFVERKAALKAGYPFRKREGYPYKVWLDAQKAYLARHDDRPLTPEIAPLFFAEAPEQ